MDIFTNVLTFYSLIICAIAMSGIAEQLKVAVAYRLLKIRG